MYFYIFISKELDKETMQNSKVLVETAFGKISRVIKTKNIKPEIAFKSFDLHNKS